MTKGRKSYDPDASYNILTFAEAWEKIFEKAISKDQLYKRVREGDIPHIRIGAKILFRRDTLETWFKEQESYNVD